MSIGAKIGKSNKVVKSPSRKPLRLTYPVGIRDHGEKIGVGGTSKAVFNSKTAAMKVLCTFYESTYQKKFFQYRKNEIYSDLSDKSIMKAQETNVCTVDFWKKFAAYIKDDYSEKVCSSLVDKVVIVLTHMNS